jgi:hypothetical protein
MLSTIAVYIAKSKSTDANYQTISSFSDYLNTYYPARENFMSSTDYTITTFYQLKHIINMSPLNNKNISSCINVSNKYATYELIPGILSCIAHDPQVTSDQLASLYVFIFNNKYARDNILKIDQNVDNIVFSKKTNTIIINKINLPFFGYFKNCAISDDCLKDWFCDSTKQCVYKGIPLPDVLCTNDSQCGLGKCSSGICKTKCTDSPPYMIAGLYKGAFCIDGLWNLEKIAELSKNNDIPNVSVPYELFKTKCVDLMNELKKGMSVSDENSCSCVGMN